MNVNFKPLGIAAAVAAASAGYAGAVNAQASYASATELGDLAIVPYYTTEGSFATGVNIINSSERTQVIKFRFRRAEDSMDALDFNVVLSPYDMYTGFIAQNGDGDITFTSNDNSCTAPAMDGNTFTMPPIYREGAETGYIEIISMGSPVSETSAIALDAKHDATGVPLSCDGVRDHFFAGGVAGSKRGVVDSVTTVAGSARKFETVAYNASPDSLKVSYFIKSDETGVEFGDNAVHIAGFLGDASMTNQQTGVFSGDLQGFDHPDLNGGAPASQLAMTPVGAKLGKYNELRGILGATELLNDWSANNAGDFTVDTDWVVTIPGQYVMLNLPAYLATLAGIEGAACPASTTVASCDNRDIPMTARFSVFDREEQGIVVEEGDLVVSPQPPSEITVDVLDKEVNVIQWGEAPVLEAPAFIEVPTPDGAKFGWSALNATSRTTTVGVASLPAALQICQYDGSFVSIGGTPFPGMDCSTAATGSAPLVGFVAWQRAFAALPSANYGRIVEHSRIQSSS